MTADLDPGKLRLAAADLRAEADRADTVEMAARFRDHATAFEAEADRIAATEDDGRRYALTGPRGISEALDNLSPADHHTIAVYGSQDLARRLAEADELGVCVSWRRVDDAGDVAEP